VTEFQKYCKQHPDALLQSNMDLFLKFKEFNPSLSGKAAEKKMSEEITELFFNRQSMAK
jgi:hypothetical protein